MKDNTLNKRGKRAKWVIEQIINDHKQLRNEENHETYLLYFFLKIFMSNQSNRRTEYL